MASSLPVFFQELILNISLWQALETQEERFQASHRNLGCTSETGRVEQSDVGPERQKGGALGV